MRATSAASTTDSDSKPTTGEAKSFRAGRYAISSSATAAMLPRRPARGTARRRAGPQNEAPILNNPMHTTVAIATRQVRSASFVARNVGPITPKAMPKVEGVSSPSGIAVTVRLPVRRARRIAIQV